MFVGLRVEAFSDALLLAFLAQNDVVRVVRLPKKQAMEIAALLSDEVDSGTLRDIASEQPASKHRH